MTISEKTAASRNVEAGSRAGRARPDTRGVHHLALCTDDIKKTTEFYTRVLGMPLIHAMKVPPGLGKGAGNRGNPPYEETPHYFFDMGNDSTIAFFEIPRNAQPEANRNAVGAMQHCAFVTTPEKFAELEQRLRDNNVEYIGPIPQLPGLMGIYFIDPNGIRLEFSCQPADGAAQRVIDFCSQTKSETKLELAGLPGVDAAWLEEMTAHLRD